MVGGKGNGRSTPGADTVGSSKDKGDIAEKIVAMLHEASAGEVRRDVMLPAKNDASRRRQFDVLLLGNVKGYPVVLAVECKNYMGLLHVGGHSVATPPQPPPL